MRARALPPPLASQQARSHPWTIGTWTLAHLLPSAATCRHYSPDAVMMSMRGTCLASTTRTSSSPPGRSPPAAPPSTNGISYLHQRRAAELGAWKGGCAACWPAVPAHGSSYPRAAPVSSCLRLGMPASHAVPRCASSPPAVSRIFVARPLPCQQLLSTPVSTRLPTYPHYTTTLPQPIPPSLPWTHSPTTATTSTPKRAQRAPLRQHPGPQHAVLDEGVQPGLQPRQHRQLPAVHREVEGETGHVGEGDLGG